LQIYRPDGERFLSYSELAALRQQEKQRAEQAIAQLAAERQRTQLLADRLRQMGVDPNQV